MAGRDRETVRAMTRYSASALEMGVSVVIGLAIGYWLETIWPQTKPWMMLFWLTCGTIAGIRSLFRLAKKLEREEAEGNGDDSTG
jgi:F0F1-type ATP synthase assembly protein I